MSKKKWNEHIFQHQQIEWLEYLTTICMHIRARLGQWWWRWKVISEKQFVLKLSVQTVFAVHSIHMMQTVHFLVIVSIIINIPKVSYKKITISIILKNTIQRIHHIYIYTHVIILKTQLQVTRMNKLDIKLSRYKTKY
jgi:hypothetical protein